jgi:hypothetical protein
MSKASNGNGHEKSPVAEALAASKARTDRIPGGHLITRELESFVQFHPGADEQDLATVINERTISACQLLENFYQSVIDPAVRDLRFLRVATPDEKNPRPSPSGELDSNLAALIAASWGSRLADDLGFLRGSYCTLKAHQHGICSHLRELERIIKIEPGSVTVQAEDGTERIIDRIQLVLDHREIHSIKLAVYTEKIIEPMRKLIDDTVRGIAARARAENDRGIIYDHRE